MSQNLITIVINTYKSQEKIFKCLNSININYKVIIIENSNNDFLKNKIVKKFSNINYFLAGKNLGYAKGNNMGLSKVITPYALIINPDTILHKDSINNFFITANRIKDFAIIAPAIQDEYNLNNNIDELTEVNSVKGFAMFLNIEQFKNVGFFDENFFIYLEEIDLCRRLRNQNKKIFLDPTIIIDHQGGSSHDEKYNFEMELSRNWHWMWSTFYYAKKYNGFIFALNSILKKFLSSIFKFIFYFLIFKKNKSLIYKQRLSGLYNSIIGKPSWYRPFENN